MLAKYSPLFLFISLLHCQSVLAKENMCDSVRFENHSNQIVTVTGEHLQWQIGSGENRDLPSKGNLLPISVAVKKPSY